MRHHPLWLLLPIVALGAAEDSLANLIYLNDRLELHPRAGLGGRYDSNITAQTEKEDEVDEFSAIGMAGLGLSFAWSETTSFIADGEVRQVLSDQPDHWRTLGDAEIGVSRRTPRGSAAARGTYHRSDEPDQETGERLLVDTWLGELSGDHNWQVHRISGRLSFDRRDYQDASFAFGEDDRDANTYAVTLGYGLRLERGDEMSLRVVGDRREYDSPGTFQQDSSGLHGLVGWNRQVSEAVGLSIEVGAEYRRYERNNTASAGTVLSPTWLVDARTVTANDSVWSLTFAGGVQDTIAGNPALASQMGLAWKRPITPTWALHASGNVYNLDDLESVGGQPEDERWTVGATLGVSHILRPGLTAEADGGYEYSDSEVQGDYDRILARAGITARF
jgi:hypothetical protein